MQLKSIVLAAIAACTVAFSAWAHHSHGAYAMTEYTQFAGTVTDVYWINPHAWIHLDVTQPDGTVEKWMIEGGPPNSLVRRGFTKNSLRIF